MIKKLLHSIREYKAASIRTAIFAGLEVLLEIIIPFFMSDIIDKGIYGGNMNVLMKLGLMMAVCVLLGLVLGFLADPYTGTERGCAIMGIFSSFLLSVLAGIVCHYICKWLDRDN